LNGELEELLQNVHDRTDVAVGELSDALIPLDPEYIWLQHPIQYRTNETDP
jgi:hypothetical protein